MVDKKWASHQERNGWGAGPIAPLYHSLRVILFLFLFSSSFFFSILWHMGHLRFYDGGI